MIERNGVIFTLAKTSDKDKIIDFMDKYWGSKHPLIHNENFFNYYYVNGENLNFAIASENGEVVAICGYILANKSGSDIWASIWLSKKGCNGVGLELMSLMTTLTGAENIACNNIRKKTMPLYEFMGYFPNRLPHYYRLANKSEYKVAKNVNFKEITAHGNGTLTPILSEDDIPEDFKIDNSIPRKDKFYIVNRFLKYPYADMMDYSLYGYYECGKLKSIIVIKKVCVWDANVLRIVDYIGDVNDFGKLGKAIDDILIKEYSEYIDFYVYGIDEKILSNAGFTQRLESDEIIIPNYLSPPLFENIEYYFFTSNDDNFIMCKADGDQDRPNL